MADSVVTWHLRACLKESDTAVVDRELASSYVKPHYAILTQGGCPRSHLLLCSSGHWRPPRPYSDPTRQLPSGWMPSWWRKVPWSPLLPPQPAIPHCPQLIFYRRLPPEAAGPSSGCLASREFGALNLLSCKHRDWAHHHQTNHCCKENLNSSLEPICNFLLGHLGIQTTWD